VSPLRSRVPPEAPPPFEISRNLAKGGYPLLQVFPGFDSVPPFALYPFPARTTRAVLKRTSIQVIPDRTWMYVAPQEPSPWAKKYGWDPFVSATDCIVVGQKHLAKSRSMILYLDVLHEFLHILQREDGRELWDISKGYVGNPTEIEAYRFSVDEARRLGVSDSFLRRYLRVEWVSAKDHLRLLKSLGVPPQG
jgi:hypothetical protein